MPDANGKQVNKCRHCGIAWIEGQPKKRVKKEEPWWNVGSENVEELCIECKKQEPEILKEEARIREYDDKLLLRKASLGITEGLEVLQKIHVSFDEGEDEDYGMAESFVDPTIRQQEIEQLTEDLGTFISEHQTGEILDEDEIKGEG